MSSQKPRVFTSYDKLSLDIKNQLKLRYPEGFSHELINFYDKDGLNVSALIFETDEKILLIKMSQTTAERIIYDDDDYDDDGVLKEDVRESLEEEYMDNAEDSDDDEDVSDDRASMEGDDDEDDDED